MVRGRGESLTGGHFNSKVNVKEVLVWLQNAKK